MTHAFRRFAAFVFFAAVVAPPLAAQPAHRASSADAVQRLSESLKLDDAQATRLDAIAARYAGEPEPGQGWQLAAEIENVLTPVQVESLAAQRTERREARRGDRGQREIRPRGQRRDGARRGARRGGHGRHADLSESDRTALRQIHETARTERNELVAALRSGTLSADAFEAQSRALRERTREQARALLPADAVAKMDERHERRETAKAARIDALDLSAAQQGQLRALRIESLRTRPERLDREARRAMSESEREAHRAEMREQRQARRAAVESVLTDEQVRIQTVHDALVGPRGRRGRGHRGMRGRGF